MDRKNRDNNEEIEIDIMQLFSVVLSKIVVILIVGIMFGLLAFFVSEFLIKPTYKSTTRIYVLNKQNNSTTTSYSDLQSASQLTQDYMELIKSRTVLEKVISELGYDMSYGQLSGMVSVSNKTNTRILDITVEGKDQVMVQKLADKIAKVSSSSICSIMDIDQVNLVDSANFPTSPSSPNVIKNTILAIVVGMFLTIAIVIIKFLLNDTMSTSEDIEKYLGLSTLALIPLSDDLDDNSDSKKRKKKKSKSHSHSSSVQEV